MGYKCEMGRGVCKSMWEECAGEEQRRSVSVRGVQKNREWGQGPARAS